jgi:transposase
MAEPLMRGFDARAVMADRGYDTDAIVALVQGKGAEAVIPPRKHRKVQRDYDLYLYRLRHLVENAFMRLKGWRGIATRYAKRTSSFLACVHIACMMMRLKFS